MTPDEYADALLAAGWPESEVARAYFYVTTFGMKSVSKGCASFAEPSCGDWNCVKPDHQRLVPA